jgi:hypothetical protein
MTEETPNTSGSSSQDKMRGAFEQFLEHQRRSFEETGRAIDSLLPPPFKEHSAIARDEFRKSLKVLVDAVVDELEGMTKIDPKETATDRKDSSSDDEPPSTTGRTKVKVQVD